MITSRAEALRYVRRGARTAGHVADGSVRSAALSALMGIIWNPEVVEQKQVTLIEPPGWRYTHIDRVISLIVPDDRRSIRIATKIGERFDREDVDPVHGEPVHIYAISRP